MWYRNIELVMVLLVYPDGELGGLSPPPLNLRNVFELYAQKYCPVTAPPLTKVLNFVQENVKLFHAIFTFFFSFWGVYPPDFLPGLFPWIPLGEFHPQDSLARPLLENSRSSPMNPLRCKMLGTPMVRVRVRIRFSSLVFTGNASNITYCTTTQTMHHYILITSSRCKFSSICLVQYH